MSQRTNPPIGSFNRSNADPKMTPAPLPPPIQDEMHSNEGSEAVRKFIESGKYPNAGSFLQSYPDLPPVGAPQTTVDGGTASLDHQIEELRQSETSLKNSPEATYLERLKKHEISLDKAQGIVDAILFKGEYQETYPVTSRHNVTFRSRAFSDQERALKALEQYNPQFPATMAAVVSKANLAASLVRFADRDFSKMSIRDKFEYIEKLPEPLVRILAIKLGKFDQMLMDILDDGVIENF